MSEMEQKFLSCFGWLALNIQSSQKLSCWFQNLSLMAFVQDGQWIKAGSDKGRRITLCKSSRE